MKLPALPPKLASLFKRKTAAERLAERLCPGATITTLKS